MEEFCSVREAAEILNIGIHEMKGIIKRGNARKLGDYVYVSDLKEILERRKVKPVQWITNTGY